MGKVKVGGFSSTSFQTRSRGGIISGGQQAEVLYFLARLDFRPRRELSRQRADRLAKSDQEDVADDLSPLREKMRRSTAGPMDWQYDHPAGDGPARKRTSSPSKGLPQPLVAAARALGQHRSSPGADPVCLTTLCPQARITIRQPRPFCRVHRRSLPRPRRRPTASLTVTVAARPSSFTHPTPSGQRHRSMVRLWAPSASTRMPSTR